MKNRDLRIPFLLGIGLVLFFSYFVLHFSKYPIDDAFIHLRIARNIAGAGLPEFNLGERVLGSSPHLWINLLALFLFFNPDSFAFVAWLEVAFVILGFVQILVLLGSQFHPVPRTLLAGLTTALLLLPSAAGLMETPLAICIFLAAVRAFENRQFVWLGFWVGTLVTVRMEYFILVPLVLIFLTEKKEFKKYATGLALPLAAFFSYTFWYFGTPVPFPAIAKKVVYNIGFREFVENIPAISNYPSILNPALPSGAKAWMILASAFALICLVANQVRQRQIGRGALLMFVFGQSLLLAYAIRSVFVFSWYAPLFSVPIALSLLLQFNGKKLAWVSALFFASMVNSTIVGCADLAAAVSGHDEFLEEYATGWRVHQYLAIGEKLWHENPRQTVLAPEIGGLGWSFKGHLIDACALVSPETLKYHPLSVPTERKSNFDGAIPLGAALDLKPDTIVSLPRFSMVLKSRSDSQPIPYKAVDRYPILPKEESERTHVWGVWEDSEILVFRRQNLD